MVKYFYITAVFQKAVNLSGGSFSTSCMEAYLCAQILGQSSMQNVVHAV